MKSLYLSALLFALCASAQVPSPANPTTPPAAASAPAPDTVLATIDGKKLTYADFDRLIKALAPQMQQNVLRDKRAFLQQYTLMTRLSEQAEKDKLDQQSPQKEMLLFQRMNTMAQFALNEVLTKIVILPEDQKKAYEANAERYKQVKVKVIYQSFVSNPESMAEAKKNGKNPLSEAEAKAKIEKLRKDAQSGADFGKLAKENSEDVDSARKDGDFGTLRRSDNIPDAIRAAIFDLKQGGISEPVRQPNGYYIFKVEEVGVRPYDQAIKDEIYNELKQAKFKEWLDGMNANVAAGIKIENEEFFKPQGPPPAMPQASPIARPGGQ